MNNISVLVVEDEELFAEQVEMKLEKMGCQVIGIVDNSADALRLVKAHLPDIVLMDVNIEGDFDGVELAEKIIAIKKIPIVFITSLADNDGVFRRISRLAPAGFLSKPFTDIQLQRTLELAVKQLENRSNTDAHAPETNCFFIKNNLAIEKVHVSDILYIQADGRYTLIRTENKKHLIRKAFQEVLSQLPKDVFAQTHRSYAVNMRLISKVDLSEYMVELGTCAVPISQRNKAEFLGKFEML